MSTELKNPKPLPINPYQVYKNQTVVSPVAKNLFKNTMFEFRSGQTPKKRCKEDFVGQDHCGSETETLPTVKHLIFKSKEPIKTTNKQNKMIIPLSQENSDVKASNGVSNASPYSSSENIEVNYEYNKLFQEDLSTNERSLPQQVTFRSKFKGNNDKSQQHISQNKNKSPHAISLKKKVSIQFTGPKSPKYMLPQKTDGTKLLKTMSTFDFNSQRTTEPKLLKEQIIQDNFKQIKYPQRPNTEKAINREGSFLEEISTLKQIILELNAKLNQKEQQYHNKQKTFLEQISILTENRANLQRKLENITIPPDDQKYSYFTQLQQKLNCKDKRIHELQIQNHKISSKVDGLVFQLQNLKPSTIKPPPSTNASDLSVFQEALKYSIEQVTRYKQRIQAKQQQITFLKQTYGLIKGETERAKNQLSIEQLKRITEVQTLKTTSEAQKNAKSNQIRDLKHKIELLDNKNKSLVKQIKEKDNFIKEKINQK